MAEEKIEVFEGARKLVEGAEPDLLRELLQVMVTKLRSDRAMSCSMSLRRKRSTPLGPKSFTTDYADTPTGRAWSASRRASRRRPSHRGASPSTSWSDVSPRDPFPFGRAIAEWNTL